MRGNHETMLVERPRTAKDALAAYAREPKALPLAGGTDVMVGWNLGLFNGRRVLDLSAVRDWARIGLRRDGSLCLGSLATHAAVQRDENARKLFPLLVQACSTVGAAQIQNRGTIGGNLANASPAGDSFPPLAVYEAVVTLASTAGCRDLPVLELFAGVKKTTLREGELIQGVLLKPLAKKPSRQMFRKVGTRQAQAISKIVAAGLLWLSKTGEVEELRFAMGSVAPTCRRLKTVESFVKGRKLVPAVVDEAVGLVDRDINPIDDIRSTRNYRLAVARNLVKAFLEDRS